MCGGGGHRNQTEAVKQAVRELPSCHHKSVAGQQVVAEIIPQIILLLTVRGMRNEGQQCVCGCTKWVGGSFFAKDMPDAQRAY